MAKIAIYHFHNGSGGGVLSVIRNLLLYRQHSEIQNHVIYTINKDHTPTFITPGLEGAASEQVFYYSSKWNFYYTSKKLAKLLPDDNALIVANDWLELGMVSNLGLRNPVLQILHGNFEYYFKLAELHSVNVDAFICVSKVIADKLAILLPSFQSKIHFLRFPVPDIKPDFKDFKNIRCTFFVRDLKDHRKQANILPLINRKLYDLGINIEWHIAGGGMDVKGFVDFWGDSYTKYVNFYGELNISAINRLLKRCNVMILPSLSEGFPVSLVEAMKHGLVPFISKWDGSVSELVKDGFSGFYFDYKDVNGYVEKLYYAATHPEELEDISCNASKTAEMLFNPIKNTFLYEKQFLRFIMGSSFKKIKFKAYGSRLDMPHLPNFITKYLRMLF